MAKRSWNNYAAKKTSLYTHLYTPIHLYAYIHIYTYMHICICICVNVDPAGPWKRMMLSTTYRVFSVICWRTAQWSWSQRRAWVLCHYRMKLLSTWRIVWWKHPATASSGTSIWWTANISVSRRSKNWPWVPISFGPWDAKVRRCIFHAKPPHPLPVHFGTVLDPDVHRLKSPQVFKGYLFGRTDHSKTRRFA